MILATLTLRLKGRSHCEYVGALLQQIMLCWHATTRTTMHRIASVNATCRQWNIRCFDSGSKFLLFVARQCKYRSSTVSDGVDAYSNQWDTINHSTVLTVQQLVMSFTTWTWRHRLWLLLLLHKHDCRQSNIPMYVRTDIEPSELPHASIKPNSWGAQHTEFTAT